MFFRCNDQRSDLIHCIVLTGVMPRKLSRLGDIIIYSLKSVNLVVVHENERNILKQSVVMKIRCVRMLDELDVSGKSCRNLLIVRFTPKLLVLGNPGFPMNILVSKWHRFFVGQKQDEPFLAKLYEKHI